MNPLLEWAISNKKTIELEIKEVQSTLKYFPSISDFAVSLNWQGNTGIGRGMDLNPELAITKAIAEAIERIVWKKSCYLTTNGIALHTDLTLAKKFAKAELLERDLFLCHYLTNTSMSELKLTEHVSDVFKAHGIKMNCLKSRSTNFGTNYTVIATGLNAMPRFGCAVGLSFAFNVSEEKSAILKAFLECSKILLNVVSKNEIDSLNLTALDNLTYVTENDHFRWALNQDSIEAINYLLNNQRADNKKLVNCHEDEDQYVTLYSHNAPEDPPVYVVKCSNLNLQELYFGFSNSKDKINLNRLQEFANRDINLTEALKFPHPLS